MGKMALPTSNARVTIQLLQSGHWGLPLERQDERVEKIVGLFAAGRKAGADDGKGISAGIGAETTGDFLLEFGHAQVAFGLIVVEGNAQVGEEVQGPRCGACAVAE